jgi:hypothetical protein
MLRFVLAILSLGLAVLAPRAGASIDGVWWDPAQSGTGWNFSVQNDIVFGLQYGYEGADARPSFRSIIGNATYTVLPDNSVRITIVGDTFRTENFNRTTRVGPFSGVYEAGRLTLDAAGFRQTVVPFEFGYRDPLDRIRGVWLVSNLPIIGQGDSSMVLFDRNTTVQNGQVYRSFVDTFDEFGLLGYDERSRSYLAVQDNGNPNDDLFLAYVMPLDPLSYGILNGYRSNDTLVGFSCTFSTRIGNCVDRPTDLLAKALANTDGEAVAFARIVIAFGKHSHVDPSHLESLAATVGELAPIAEAMLRESAPRSDLGARSIEGESKMHDRFSRGQRAKH